MSTKHPLNTKEKRKEAIAIIGIGLLFGLIYPILSDGNAIGPLINGFLIGIIGSIFIVYNEIIKDTRVIRKYSFKKLVLFKITRYFFFIALLILIVVSFTRSIEQKMNLWEFYKSGGVHYFLFEDDYNVILIYTLAATSLFIFTYQMSRKMGQGVLIGFLTGKYHQPKEEQHIFMFLDLNGATKLAEELGDLKFNELLNDFFFDLTDCIVENQGKIYRYVGDEISVSWRLKDKNNSSQYLQTFIDAKAVIAERSDFYIQKFGVVPKFTAGFHAGKVIAGEIGSIKSQISFLGSVMSETTDIEKACSRFNSELLVSEYLLKKTIIPENIHEEFKGEITNSSNDLIRLYTIDLN